jgi:hypothetical protein
LINDWVLSDSWILSDNRLLSDDWRSLSNSSLLNDSRGSLVRSILGGWGWYIPGGRTSSTNWYILDGRSIVSDGCSLDRSRSVRDGYIPGRWSSIGDGGGDGSGDYKSSDFRRSGYITVPRFSDMLLCDEHVGLLRVAFLILVIGIDITEVSAAGI